MAAIGTGWADGAWIFESWAVGAWESDVTAPVLSNPTGIATGNTTATGTVDTDEAGTLFFFASINASETAATIKALGESQVATTGTQNVSFTGLTPGTTHFAHYVEDDAASNESNVVSSAGFETDADDTFFGAGDDQRLDEDDLMLAIIKDVAGRLM